mgnify:CR=1 FL=1
MLEKKRFSIDTIYVPAKRAKTLEPERVAALAEDILACARTVPVSSS